MQKEFLQVKVQNLSDEARYIAKKEKWALKAAQRKAAAGKDDSFFRKLREDYHNHRIKDVRQESRASHLAYGFLRGVPYRAMEFKTHTVVGPNKGEYADLYYRVQRNVLNFSGSKGSGHNVVNELAGRVAEWFAVAPTIEMAIQFGLAKKNFLEKRGQHPYIGSRQGTAAVSE